MSERQPMVIYTEATKETDPIGGFWSTQPFALRHAVWVSMEDYEVVVEERDRLKAYFEQVKDTPPHD